MDYSAWSRSNNMTEDCIEISTCDLECQTTNLEHASIQRLDKEITYDEFFQKFLIRNSPCIFSNFISENWECTKLWSKDCKPNISHIRETFGDAEVPVADCNEREYNSQKKSVFTLSKYLDYLEGHRNNDLPKQNLYLKDWHLTRDYPTAAVYRVPKYFASDWLNEYFSKRTDVQDDYRFVYIGPKGSWTPLHADVFTSYSWSVNVVGRKRWVLFPPGQEAHLRDRFGNLAYDIFSEEAHDNTRFPSCDNPGKFYDIIQEAGEALFVPSGWHHQVWNLEDTVSINHNWVNGCNIVQVWLALSSCLAAVQQEVSDCRDMDDWHMHCQLMLRATHGLNYEEFFDLLQCIADSRMTQIIDSSKIKMYGGWELGSTHAVWDLRQISNTITYLLNDVNLSFLTWPKEKDPHGLKKKIDTLLETKF